MVDVGLLRKRVRSEIEAAKRTSAERKERAAAATRAYDAFLTNIAVPAFRSLATVLRAEGILFEVQTASRGVRLASDRSRDDGIELELDDTVDPPVPMLVTTRSRGSRSLRTERAVKERIAIDKITEEDLLERLLDDLRPWLG